MSVDTCPCCGSPVRVHTGSEGTSSYEPAVTADAHVDSEPLRCRHGYLVDGDNLARRCFEDGVPRIVPPPADALGQEGSSPKHSPVEAREALGGVGEVDACEEPRGAAAFESARRRGHRAPPADALDRARETVERPPSDFWREVPCGHPQDPLAWHAPDGNWVCHCGGQLDLADAVSDGKYEGAPGPIVPCQKCGCYVALAALDRLAALERVAEAARECLLAEDADADAILALTRGNGSIEDQVEASAAADRAVLALRDALIDLERVQR